MSQVFGGNADVKGDPIWIIAARNNEKEKQVVYRVDGERVSLEEYKEHKKIMRCK